MNGFKSDMDPQEHSRKIVGIYLPGSLYFYVAFLLSSSGSLLGVSMRVRFTSFYYRDPFLDSRLCSR